MILDPNFCLNLDQLDAVTARYYLENIVKIERLCSGFDIGYDYFPGSSVSLY